MPAEPSPQSGPPIPWRGSAVHLIGIGGIILMGNLGIPHMGWGDLWPLILIAVGVLMLTDRLVGIGPRTDWADKWDRHAERAFRRGWRVNRLRESAVFWGGKRVVVDSEMVLQQLQDLISDDDVRRYIL